MLYLILHTMQYLRIIYFNLQNVINTLHNCFECHKKQIIFASSHIFSLKKRSNESVLKHDLAS